MAEAPLLEIDSLTFRYRRASEPAIRDLSLSIEPTVVSQLGYTRLWVPDLLAQLAP